jgi:hypothetical protein
VFFFFTLSVREKTDLKLVSIVVSRYPILRPYTKKKEKNNCWKKTKKYIAVRRGHGGAQRMVKDWLRKLKNTKIKI